MVVITIEEFDPSNTMSIRFDVNAQIVAISLTANFDEFHAFNRCVGCIKNLSCKI